MLSKLLKTEFELLRLIGNGRYVKGFIEPLPKIPVRKQIHSQQRDQIRKRPVEFGSELKKTQDQHRDQCCPNLDLNRISTGSDKGLDLKVLFQCFEKDLDLPALFVDGSNRRCS